MITIRPAGERGGGDYGWLDTRHTFSFSNYYDARYTGFHALRVVNEDRLAPGNGFAPHEQFDVEILWYVLSGTLQHRDSLGNGTLLRAHEWQRMSAGTGVRHSEFNASESEPLHFYQIWIAPDESGIRPEYGRMMIPPEEKTGRLALAASGDGHSGSLKINQDTRVYNAILKGGDSIEHRLGEGRGAWMQVLRGSLDLNGFRLETGDGAAATDESRLVTSAVADSELILIDLA